MFMLFMLDVPLLLASKFLESRATAFRNQDASFKVRLSPSKKKLFFICVSESILKLMKNAFYFLSSAKENLETCIQV